MAYKRRYARRYKPRRKTATPWYKKKYSVAQIAVKAAKGVRYLSGLVNSEKFKHDINVSNNIDYYGTMIPLTNIAIGDTDSTRTGNSIFVRHITNRISVSINPSYVGDFQRLRIMLLIDTQQVSDTQPGAGSVLETTGQTTSFMSLLNSDTVGRFRILKSTYVNVTQDNPIRTLDWDFNLRHHVRYNGPLSNDIQKGGIYLLLISDQPNGSTNPFVQTVNRVSYHDN